MENEKKINDESLVESVKIFLEEWSPFNIWFKTLLKEDFKHDYNLGKEYIDDIFEQLKMLRPQMY